MKRRRKKRRGRRKGTGEEADMLPGTGVLLFPSVS
jgi:hypothetical protein